MADILTMQDLANGHLDVKALGEAANGDENTIVTTRTGNTYPSAERAIKTLFENGGLPATPFASKALMTASALVDGKYAMVTDDTVNNGLYVKEAGAWVKSSYDPVVQAKAYADANKLDYTQIETTYKNGNLIGPKTKVVDGYQVINTTGAFIATGGTAVKVIPVDEGVDLFLLNTLGIYGTNKGYAFFAKDPSLDPSSLRIPHIESLLTDSDTSLKYLKVTVPQGAKFLVITTKYLSEIEWAIHENRFSDSYVTGNEVLVSVKGWEVEKQISANTLKDLGGNYYTGELYRNEGVLQDYGFDNAGKLIKIVKAPPEDWRVFRLAVNEGETYYLKLLQYDNGNRKAFYSVDYNGSDMLSSTPTNKGAVSLQPTEQADVYRFTVPTGTGIKAMFMNIKVLSYDITESLSIQRDVFKNDLIGKIGTGIYSINGNPLVDVYARQAALANVSAGRLKDKKLFAFGDSITEGTQGGYLKYIAASTGAIISNYGMSGAGHKRTVDILTAGFGLAKRDSPTASYVFPTKDFTDVAAITIMIGTNDAAHLTQGSWWGDMGDIPEGSVYTATSPLEYFESFPSTYIGNLALCIEFIKWKNPEIEVHLINPPFRFSSTTDPESENYKTGLILKIIPFLRDLCDFYACHFIPSHESGISYKGMDNTNGVYTYDGTHFNELGNKVFGKYLAQKILNFG